MLLEYAISARQAWERAKVGLQSVEDECLVDLAELSREPLEVEMASMDNGRRLKNHGGEVRFIERDGCRVGVVQRCFPVGVLGYEETEVAGRVANPLGQTHDIPGKFR